MTDYDFFVEDECGQIRQIENDTANCTNPIKEAESVKRISWLDDYGWI